MIDFTSFSSWPSMAFLIDVALRSMLLSGIIAIAVRCVSDVNWKHRIATGLLVGMLAMPALVFVVPPLPVPLWAGPTAEAIVQRESNVEVYSPTITRRSEFAGMGLAAGEESHSVVVGDIENEVSSVSGESDGRETVAGASVSGVGVLVAASPIAVFDWKLWLGIGYIGVGVLLSIRFVVGMWLSHRLAISANRIDDCFEDFGRSGVVVLETNRVQSPSTMGFFRPKILLPIGWREWSLEKRRSVISHEMAHVGRRDWLVTVLSEINCIVQWFNPITWVLRRYLAVRAEEICDDFVVRETGTRTAYARHLLEIAATMAASRSREERYSLNLSMAHSASIEDRIELILDSDRPPVRRIGAASGIMLLLVCISTSIVAARLVPVAGEPQGVSTSNETVDGETNRLNQDPDESEATADLTATITTIDGELIAGASVEVRRWGGHGEWVETKLRGTTDSDGTVSFDGLPVGPFLTVVVGAPGFATVMQDFVVAQGEHRQLTCKLGRPAESWIHVTAPDGTPLAGAEIARLEVTDSNGVQFTMCVKDFPLLASPVSGSTPDGRLTLPLLPKNAQVSVMVVHPNWTSTRVESFKIVNGKVGSAMLAAGTTVTAELTTMDGQVDHSLDGKLFGFRMAAFQFAGIGDSKIGTGLIHSFRVIDGKATFTVHHGQYHRMIWNASDVQLSPSYSYITEEQKDEFRMTNQSREFKLLVRPKISVTGRVVRRDGTPVAGVNVYADAANVVPGANATQLTGSLEWSDSDYGETDSEGRYTLSVPSGKGRLRVLYESGFYSELEYTPIDVNESGEFVVPDITALPFPILKGVVRDALGNPVPNCVIREDSWTEAAYYLTDEHGRFSFEIKDFPWDAEKEIRTRETTVVAFDPYGDGGAILKVDLNDPAIFENIEFTLEPRSLDWATEASEYSLPISEEKAKNISVAWNAVRKKYSKGLPGNTVGDLSEGIWLNTDARSLAAFRGQYVLLDFWYVGCGPCVRDLPTVKLAHKLFLDRGFSVVSVHTMGQTAENVQQYAAANGMTYPIVVDNAEGDIMKKYGDEIGVVGFPMYVLLGPDGKIVENDAVGNFSVNSMISLRRNKIEVISRYLRERKGDSK